MRRLFALLALALVLPLHALAIEPQDVTSMDEAFDLIGEYMLWQDGWPSYRQQYGFEAIRLTPEEAQQALKRAYDNLENGYARQLESWGLRGIDPYGYPEKVALGSAFTRDYRYVELEAVTFSGYGWGKDGALIFMKEEYGDWRLIDFIDGEPVRLIAADSSGEPLGPYIEMLQVGHGTGFYAENIAIYNPILQRCEAGYTKTGHECPLMDRNLFMNAWADYFPEGIRIVRASAFGMYSRDGDRYVFDQKAQCSDVYAYAYDRNNGSLTLAAHERTENLSPVLYRAQSLNSLISGDTRFIN